MKSVELQRCAEVALKQCVRLQPEERVLVVTDTMRDQSVARALVGAAIAAGSEASLLVMPARRSAPQEPPAAVIAAMQETDVVFLYTTFSHSHSSARVAAQAAGARVISIPGVTEDGFLRTLSVDIPELARVTNRLAERVDQARVARLVTPLGTDITFELGHPTTIVDGLCEQPGEIDFFPPGLFLSVPREDGVSGRAVVDGAITQIGRLSSPVTLTFEEGRLTLIEGGAEASRLERLLGSLEDDNVYRFAAWGLGTNQGAALVGEDPSFEGERMYGWGHVSTGSNATLPGGTVQAKIHLDGIIATPTVYLDGEVIAEEGRFDL